MMLLLIVLMMWLFGVDVADDVAADGDIVVAVVAVVVDVAVVL